MGPYYSQVYPCEREAEGDVEMLALKIGVMWPRGEEGHSHQKLEEVRNGFSPRASERSEALPRLDLDPVLLIADFWPLELREYIPVVISYPVCGNLLEQPQKISVGIKRLLFPAGRHQGLLGMCGGLPSPLALPCKPGLDQ